MAFEALGKLVSNTLGEFPSDALLTGILGDRPSAYAKSPSIWNPVFKAFGLNAVYVPLDVPQGSLGAVVDALRATPQYAGGNVTVPYKVEVMRYLDRIDPLAESIGAVNTIARDDTGALVGYNTDGQGALDSLSKPQPGQPAPLVESLAGARVLLLGAGGAARAVAFYLGQQLGSGRMWIANRSAERAAEMATRLRAADVSAEPLAANDPARTIGRVTLLVNATSVGQSGLRALPGGDHTILEPYSPLAPVSHRVVPSSDPEALRAWARAASEGIEDNNRRSFQLLTQLPVSAGCFDLIYSPLETTLLRQARLTGHRTLNGKGMNVAQAADALFNRVLRKELLGRGLHNAATYQRILEVMYSVW